MKKIYLTSLLLALPAFIFISCRSASFDPYTPLEGEEAGEETVEMEDTAPPPPPAPVAEKQQAVSSYGKIPPYFIRNQGQQNMPDTVKYYVKGSKGTVYLTTTEVVFDFLREKEPEEGEEEEPEEDRRPGPEREREKQKSYDRLVFRLQFAGANPQVEVAGEKELPGKINYFIGSQSNWRANIPTFEEVVYRDLYPGIDLRFYFRGANLESTFAVRPGGDPADIVLAYDGIDDLELKSSGELVAVTSFGGFVEGAPRLRQEIEGKEVEREGSYRILDEKQYTYEIPAYDDDFTLFIE